MKAPAQSPRINQLGQAIGTALPDWKPATSPGFETLSGRLCRIEPVDPARHANDLFEAIALDGEGRMWTYLPYGPFDSPGHYRTWLTSIAGRPDPLFLAIVDSRKQRAVGVSAYLRMDPGNGVLEIGHLAFSPLLQRQATATEAVYLMVRHAFELGFRRCEWKCDALNADSRAAAKRLGFVFEGIFRQAVVYKERNRDTAWYAIIDRDWPALDIAFQCWLDPANFDEHGHQRMRLSSMTSPAPGAPGGKA